MTQTLQIATGGRITTVYGGVKQKMSINPDDYSPAATIITFSNPIPLLRQPIPTSGDDNSVVLAFPNPSSFVNAYNSCEQNIINQCETGSRIGCSVSASKNCAPPWWKTLKVPKHELLIEREKCEEREMAECLEASRVSCMKFAEDKCLPAFRDARIVVRRSCKEYEVRKSVFNLISSVCFGEKRVGGVELGRFEGNLFDFKTRIGFSIIRGSDVIGKEV